MRRRRMTALAAAEALGVTRYTVRRWYEDGRLPAIETPGGQIRIAPKDVAALAARLEAERAHDTSSTLSTTQAAERLGVSLSMVHKLRRTGRLVARRNSSGRWRIPISEVDRLEGERQPV